jgi:hypothetical protein
MIQKKTQTAKKPLKGRPMGGKIGEFQDMIDKAKRGDRQAEADLKLERAKLKTFGEGPGAGASGAMPNPKKKMGGTISPAKKSVSRNISNLNKAKSGASVKKAQMGATMTAAPMMMKKGGSMKKCKYGCK